ncbi:MAG TPA: hypothetical protein VK808_10830 [Bacteroidia bacterium]|nr:hypothetical protein [Bacteroidia bacterium]
MRTFTKRTLISLAAVVLFASCSSPRHYYAYGDSYMHAKHFSATKYY